MEANFKQIRTEKNLGPQAEFSDKVAPFRTFVFSNFLDKQSCEKLRLDVGSSIKLKPQDNDLYKFKQSRDLKTQVPAKKLTSTIHDFIDLMLGPVKDHLKKITSIDLSDKVFDITASRYDVGNHLLCHNDAVKDSVGRQGRALAYIFYLNARPWTKDDGGALVLYDSDSDGEPVSINNRLFPQPNTLVVFETTETSWHAVEEVYCKNDVRLSINGWFYQLTKSSKGDEMTKSIEACPYTFLKPIQVDERIENFFKECFNQRYLMEKTCYMIRKTFKKRSEISLPDFLIKEKYDEICLALREAVSERKNLEHVGPYNKRNYHRLRIEDLPPICKDLYDAFRSELFFMLLGRLTGLYLQPPSITSEKDADDGDGDDGDDDDDDEDEEDEDEEDDDEDDDDDDIDDDDEEDEDDEVIELGSGQQKRVAEETGNGRATESSKGAQKDSATDKNLPTSSDNKEKQVTIFDESKAHARKRKRKSDPFARFEFRHLETGSYTLIHDLGYELGESSALDVILHFNHDFAVNFDDGGYICYIDGGPGEDLHDMDYELLSLEPKSNCLSLVYRCDQTTCRFMKHINKSHKGDYQDLYCVFYEKPDDIPDDPANSKMKIK